MTTRPRVPSILIIILFAYAIGTSSLVTVGRRLASFALHYSKDAKVENISKVQKGSIIEHLTAKGGKQLALVLNRTKKDVEICAPANLLSTYSVPLFKIVYVATGSYSTDDLITTQETIINFKPSQLERLWESCLSTSMMPINISFISSQLYKSEDPLKLLIARKLMQNFGDIYFSVHVPEPNSKEAKKKYASESPMYVPLVSIVVQENLKDRAALREFKQRYVRIMTNTDKSDFTGSMFPEMPERVEKVIGRYVEGLKHIIIKTHPWMANKWVKLNYEEEEVSKGLELLDFLEVAPTSKNAKKVLQIVGVWSEHENIEKHIMRLPQQFPSEVLQEAKELLANAPFIEDPDERLRRDLTHLKCYAIDQEGTTEVDDAISIEYIEEEEEEEYDGHEDEVGASKADRTTTGQKKRRRERLWVHIADVSRWIRPGSALSLEAERRMLSVFMPDERISMFPPNLSAELLSLGAKDTSYALSCGILLDADGGIESYEVCPTRVSMVRRLSYIDLESMLKNTTSLSPIDLSLEDTGMGTRSSSISSSSTVTRGGLINLGSDRSSPMSALELVESFNNARINLPSSLPSSSSTSGDSDFANILKNLESLQDKDKDKSRRHVAKKQQAVVTYSKEEAFDLARLSYWARTRQQYRCREMGALDTYLRNKTELSLSVRLRAGGDKLTISGYTVWSNVSSISLVTELMGLMSHTIGHMASKLAIPLVYKTQSLNPPMTVENLHINSDSDANASECSFLRAARIIKHLSGAVDSTAPGLHVTSGSTAYVQCTSPIRRYHDLYNHYRLKVAMHGASLGTEWAEKANEEAGITLLEHMATKEERLDRLMKVKLVTRRREQYFLDLYKKKLLNAQPPVVLSCLVNGRIPSDSNAEDEEGGDVANSGQVRGALYEALIVELGSFTRYQLYHDRLDLQPGELVRARLYEVNTNPKSLILVPTHVQSAAEICLPAPMKRLLLQAITANSTMVS